MIFLDANILLEILVPERPHKQAVHEYLAGCSDSLGLSTLSANLIMHFCRREGLGDNALHDAIAETELLALLPADYTWAQAHEVARDFEDALQVAVALRTGCDRIITLDGRMARRYMGHIAFTKL